MATLLLLLLASASVATAQAPTPGRTLLKAKADEGGIPACQATLQAAQANISALDTELATVNQQIQEA